MSKKRKHHQLEDHDDSKTTTEQSIEKSNAQSSTDLPKSKGQLRQEKSERRAKKQKKSRDERNEEDKSTTHATSMPPSAVSTPAKDSKLEPEARAQKKEKKKAKSQEEVGEKTSARARFIVFVGNLPYDVTVGQIEAHFSKISPTSVRLSTNKGTGKSKGFAFVEFDNYDKMKTCLKLYHHSIFEPDTGKKEKHAGGGAHGDDNNKQNEVGTNKGKGRRINVELTAGGGGKSKERKAKIRSKNHKLGEERERRRVKDLAERDKEGSKQKTSVETGANATEVKDARGDIHPSRLSRVSH